MSGFGPRRWRTVAGRALRWVAGIGALARHADGRRPGRCGEADLVEARLLASQWQSRAEAAERRIAELERRIASSDMTALDLRSRVVCLHGKLATSTATARYQLMTLALAGERPRAASDRTAARGSSRT